MTREQIKELLPIIQAFADGKEIEVKTKEGSRWCKFEDDDINLLFEPEKNDFRIKPQYRPFKDKEECWEEMKKHQPFGWVRYKDATISIITELSLNCVSIGKNYYFKEAKEVFTFADGTPFGIKDE